MVSSSGLMRPVCGCSRGRRTRRERRRSSAAYAAGRTVRRRGARAEGLATVARRRRARAVEARSATVSISAVRHPPATARSATTSRAAGAGRASSSGDAEPGTAEQGLAVGHDRDAVEPTQAPVGPGVERTGPLSTPERTSPPAALGEPHELLGEPEQRGRPRGGEQQSAPGRATSAIRPNGPPHTRGCGRDRSSRDRRQVGRAEVGAPARGDRLDDLVEPETLERCELVRARPARPSTDSTGRDEDLGAAHPLRVRSPATPSAAAATVGRAARRRRAAGSTDSSLRGRRLAGRRVTRRARPSDAVAAATASRNAARRPAASSSRSPAAVVPPGDVTAARSASGPSRSGRAAWPSRAASARRARWPCHAGSPTSTPASIMRLRDEEHVRRARNPTAR